MAIGLRGEVVVAMTIAVAAATGIGLLAIYALPASPNSGGTLADCGYSIACAATNPSGFAIDVTTNGTSIGPNGAVEVDIQITNPSGRPINMTSSRNWYLPSFSQEFCNDTASPLAIAVLRGYYTPENVSSGQNVVSNEYNRANFTSRCESINVYASTHPNVFHFFPHGMTLEFNAGDFCPINERYSYTYPSTGNMCGWPLESDKPGVYTIAVGDFWGDLVLVNFSVHS